MEVRRDLAILLLVALAAGLLLVLAPQLMPTAVVKPSTEAPSAIAVAPRVSVAPTTTIPLAPGIAPTAAPPAPTFFGAPDSPCPAATLQAHGGRQGESGTAHGEVVLMNVGAPCSLGGDPLAITLVTAKGVTLPTTLGSGHGMPIPTPLTVPGMGSASLGIDWANWCGPNPGSLRIRITLPKSGGVLTGSFDGPPDYDFVPRCDHPERPSFIELLWGFTLVHSPNPLPYTYVGYTVTGAGRYSLEIDGMAWTIDGPAQAGWVAVDGDAPAVVEVRSLPSCAVVLRSTIHPGPAWYVEVTPRSARVIDLRQGGDLAGFTGPGRPPVCPPLPPPSESDAQP